MGEFEVGLLDGSSFHVVNQGCKVNRVEADTICARLSELGGIPAKEAGADIIVVNTCTVTGEADKKARKAVRRALKSAPNGRVLVTGCAVSVDADTYRALGERVEVVERSVLLMKLDEAIADRPACPTQVGHECGDAVPLRYGKGFRTRVSIKVQDGCDRACTFCIVHVARGPARSAPFDEVLREAEVHLREGAKEIVLAGIDLGSYRSCGRGLADLVSELLEIADKTCPVGERPARVRSSSLEPITVDERFVELLATSDGRLCRHLHLPLQSGSTKVLREMGRPYSAQWYEERVQHLYERIPRLSLTTDIICGFPGETDDEFSQTIDLARRCRFSKIHVFPYSRREGTPAAARSDQVDDGIKARRAAQLRALSDELRARDLESRRTTTELAIVKDEIALSESYHELARPSGSQVGSLVPIVL